MIERYCVDLTEDIAQHIINLRRTDTRVRQRRSWQNPPTALIPVWMQSVYQQVCEHVGNLDFQDWWANVSYRSHETRWHSHPQYDRVAVLYITVPSGAIEFESGESILPNAGDVLIFPASLAHQVCPNTTDSPRISVAFNFSVR